MLKLIILYKTYKVHPVIISNKIKLAVSDNSILLFIFVPHMYDVLKCHCKEKIVDPILNATEQHF